MRRTKKSVSPVVDVAEPRVLLSAATPLVGQHTLNAVTRDVGAIMNALGRTENHRPGQYPAHQALVEDPVRTGGARPRLAARPHGL